MPKKRRPVPRVNVYIVIERAVEEGIAYGWRRSFKYDDTPVTEDGPRAHAAKEALRDAIMGAFDEVLLWEE